MSTKKTPKAPVYIGKRKKAVARAFVTKGTGNVSVNNVPLGEMTNKMVQLRIQEPLLIAGDINKHINISVIVNGGGIMGQAEASRQAIARALIAQQPELKEQYLKYDRFMIVYDPRRTEPHKPPHSSWGARRYKQRSKR